MHIIRQAYPLIHRKTPGIPKDMAGNINGPALLAVPDWIKKPLGRYYLYFSHHHGRCILMAYADEINGPYIMYGKGVLNNNLSWLTGRHVASPEIFADHEKKIIRLYFHADIKGTGYYTGHNQMTYLAFSENGLDFINTENRQIAPCYLRIFRFKKSIFGIARNTGKGGLLLKSKDGIESFEYGPQIIPDMRHCAVLQKEHGLYVFYTRIMDCPERILCSRIKLGSDWQQWKTEEAMEIMAPETEWEGVRLALKPSKPGATGPTRALRDPFVFEDGKKLFLFYTVKGEAGIAAAEICDFPGV
ncbi:MAG: hypothetical protein A2096_11165 [Spirochaetes bacterium GWF1_41_5]|nr:MAG: hypothetical protein A2096_11165 [Spirochaetes bacterium GWF1_41_5]HBE01361.1 hypothetical protein [Spirochaetia bacterium]